MRRIRVFDPLVLSTFLETLPVGLILVQAENLEVVAISKPAYEFLGRPRSELEGKPLAAVIRHLKLFGPNGEAAELRQLPIVRACTSGEVIVGEQWSLEDHAGRHVAVLVNATPVYDNEGLVLGGLACWTNVTNLKAVEQQLRESVATEAMLLQESNYRIKNHLQMLSALLQIEGQRSGITAGDVITSMEERLSVLSTAYESFCSSDIRGSVNAAWLLERLIGALNSPRHPISAHSPPDLTLDDRQVTPVALAINESISNALKHAFPGGQAGGISVSLDRDAGALALEIADDGKGLPEHGVHRGLGTQILGALARQLDGSLTLENQRGGGAVVRLRFPESPTKNRTS